MGQRGHRRYRYRCTYVDPRTGVRCDIQVKRAGGKFCGIPHRALAQRKAPPSMQPLGARARRRQARDRMEAGLRAGLALLFPDARQLAMALRVAMETYDVGYETGYTAGHAKASLRTRSLRFEQSRDVLSRFLGSRAGKAFVVGTIRPEQLADLSFGETGARPR